MPVLSSKAKCVLRLLLTIPVYAGMAWAGPALASSMPPQTRDAAGPPQKSLMDLGRDFARRLGNNLTQADLYLSGAGKLELAEHKAQTQLPDNEPLLLHGVLGESKVNLEQDIYSVKRGPRLLMSLSDFCGAAGLAITVNPAEGTASGWFLRSDRKFSLDAKKGEVVTQGQTLKINPADIDAEGTDILVSAETLEKWFGLSFDYDFANLNVKILTTEVFPAESAFIRAKKKGKGNFYDSVPKLPYQPEPYAKLSQPYIDTNINLKTNRAPDRPAENSALWSTVLSGDVAGLNAQGFISGNDKDPYIDSARLTLGKQDVNGGLLGPLHATSYQIGDVGTVSQPLIGGGAQELGVSVSSKPLFTTTETSTQIRGNAQPGWDVELYRNDSYIDIRHIENDGLYDFENIDLVEGDNDFKLLFYSPQGDIREEHKHIGVNPTAIRNSTGNYSVSLTQNGTNLWESTEGDFPGKGAPHIAAEYEYGVAGLGTVSVGARGNSDNGTYRGLAQAGLATYVYGTFLNANVGVDPARQSVSTQLTARHNFDRQSLLVQYALNSPNYNSSSAEFGANVRQFLRTNLSGPLAGDFLFFDRTNYNLSASYSDLYSGGSLTSLGGSLSTSVGSTLFSANIDYDEDKTPEGDVNQRAVSNFGLRGFALGGTWRLSAEFQNLPEEKFNEGQAEYYHPIGENIDISSKVEYKPEPELTTGSLGLNWRTSKATISPSIQYDTDKNMRANVNVHFGLGADPYTKDYKIYNKYLSSTGGVAALIYMDANGDGVYNQGDELLPDVRINAVQEHRFASSDNKGIAFIPDLEQNRLTDVILDTTTLQDSYSVSLFEGVSIRPHPGKVTKLEFPIVVAGEMDGQADFTDKNGNRQSAHNLDVSLVAPDGKVEKTTAAAYDGYWSISTIRPGFYYLTVEADQSTPGYMLPRPIEFTAGGSTYFGQTISLKSGHVMPFKFRATNERPDGPKNTRVVRASDVASQQALLELGPYHSRLAMAFAWYKFKLHGGDWNGKFSLETPLSKIKPDKATGTYSIVVHTQKAMSMKEAAETCEDLESMKFSCAVQVITTYKNTFPEPAPQLPLVAVKREEDEEPAKEETKEEVAATAPQPEVAEPIRPKAAGTVVVMNLGSYNSRLLMSVMWYKLKTRYAQAIGDAHVLVRPSDSVASPATGGKHILRAAIPQNNAEEAGRRCALLRAQGQGCTVETVSSDRQVLSSAATDSKG